MHVHMNIEHFEQNKSYYIQVKVKYKKFQGDKSTGGMILPSTTSLYTESSERSRSGNLQANCSKACLLYTSPSPRD